MVFNEWRIFMQLRFFRLLATFLFCLFLILPFSPGFNGEKFQMVNSAIALSGGNGPMGSNIFVEIAKKENPSVVNVSIKSKRKPMRSPRRGPGSKGPGGKGQDPFRDFYDRFFGEKGSERPKRGMGSGFVIDQDGHILTNHHVIEDADEIKVTFQDDKEYDAKLIGADSKTDIALIKIILDEGEEKKFPYLELGNSDDLEVGEWVMAIGNPFGLAHTVTVGVVSAKGRNIGAGPYDDFIQTDASINPGNSGGPLINIKGHVVGINTAIISGNTGGNVGIGFALPINLARNILTDLKEHGSVTRGWLGVMIQKITPELANSFGLEQSEGALVGDVIPNSPAAKGGIERGDVIVKFNNKDVVEMEMLPKIVAGTSPGITVPVEVVREGAKKIISVTIEVLKDAEEQVASLGDPLGLQVQDITPELAQSLDLEDSEGVLVADVQAGEAGGEAGVRRGDVISEVNRKPIKNIADYKMVTSKIKKGGTVLLLVKRSGSTIYIAVKTG